MAIPTQEQELHGSMDRRADARDRSPNDQPWPTAEVRRHRLNVRDEVKCGSQDVRFRNGPLFVKPSEWYLATGFVLPSVVDKVATTLCVSDRIRGANLLGRDPATRAVTSGHTA